MHARHGAVRAHCRVTIVWRLPMVNAAPLLVQLWHVVASVTLARCSVREVASHALRTVVLQTVPFSCTLLSNSLFHTLAGLVLQVCEDGVARAMVQPLRHVAPPRNVQRVQSELPGPEGPGAGSRSDGG